MEEEKELKIGPFPTYSVYRGTEEEAEEVVTFFGPKALEIAESYVNKFSPTVKEKK